MVISITKISPSQTFAQGQAEVTVAIPNGDLGKMASDQGYIDWVVSELRKHRSIIKLVMRTLSLLLNLPDVKPDMVIEIVELRLIYCQPY